MNCARGLAADPIDILIRHNAWATLRVIDFCREISDEAFHRRLGIGPGSLHDTLTHIIAAMRSWADRIDGRPIRHRIEVPEGHAWTYQGPASEASKPPMPRRGLDELAAFLLEATDDLNRVYERGRQRGLGTPFTIKFGEKSYTFSIAAAMSHVLTHGVHHRAQCLVMLRQLGARCFEVDAPEIGVVDWQAEVETNELEPYRCRPFAAGAEYTR